MKSRNIVMYLMLLLVFMLAACGGNATHAMDKPEDKTMEKPTEEAVLPHDATMPDTMEKMAEDAMLMGSPAWYGASLTNVQTGEAFTVNGFRGKVILVETMAVWCSTCYKQQLQVQSLHTSLGGRDDFASLALDTDPNEDASQLKSYSESNGFSWTYAIAPVEVAREISDLYGAQFLNPPSAPMLIIDRKGVAHPLPFGIKSMDDLLDALNPFLDESM